MIAPISVIVKIGLQEIREKEDFQDNEHDKKLNQNDQPNLFPPAGKVRKPIIVKPEDLFKDIHNCSDFWRNS
jgi:hypothetical protein